MSKIDELATWEVEKLTNRLNELNGTIKQVRNNLNQLETARSEYVNDIADLNEFLQCRGDA